jgi:hypothetical protein
VCLNLINDCVIYRYLVKTRKEKSGGLSVKYLIGEESGPKTVDTTLEGIVKLYRRAAVGCDCQMVSRVFRYLNTFYIYVFQVS